MIFRILFIIIVVLTSCTKKASNRKFYVKLSRASYDSYEIPHFNFVLEYDNPKDEIFLITPDNLYLVYKKDTIYFPGKHNSRPFLILRTTDKIEFLFRELLLDEDPARVKTFIKKGQLFVGNSEPSYTIDSLRKKYYMRDFKDIKLVWLQNMEVSRTDDFKFYKGGAIYDSLYRQEYVDRLIDLP